MQAEGIEAVSTSKDRVISFDHDKLKDFTDRNINALSKELESLAALTDKELFEKYLKPTLPKFKQEYDQKLVDFTKFQIEKSTALIADAVEHGHVGTNYQSNIDVVNSNGLTIREMLAITYVESQDENKLIRAGKPYADLDLNDKKLCKLEAQMKFIDGLHSIRRGYNIDAGHDNKDTLEFSRDEDDKNVCSGGVINRTINSLNSVHSDVEIRVVDLNSVKNKIQQILPDLINEYIANERQNGEINLAMDLKHWQETNKMPDRLQAEIAKTLSHVLDENHKIIQEFSRDFSQSEISGNIARGALKSYKYPTGEITKIDIELNSEKNPDILEYYKNNPYTIDEKGNHILTIDYEMQKDPTLIKTLIERYFDLEGYYVKRDGRMNHISSEYLRYNDDLPAKLISYMENYPSSFSRVINNSSEDKMHNIISNLMYEASATRIRDFLKIFPEDNIKEGFKTFIIALVEKEEIPRLLEFIILFPDNIQEELAETCIPALAEKEEIPQLIELAENFTMRGYELLNAAIPALVKKLDTTTHVLVEKGREDMLRVIIDSYPEDKQHEILKVIIPIVAEKESSLKHLIKIFPEEDKRLEIAKIAIPNLIEENKIEEASNIIGSLHTNKRIELLKVTVDELLTNNKNNEADKLLDNFPINIKVKAMEELLDEKGYNPEIANKLSIYNKAFAMLSEVGKFMNDVHGNGSVDIPQTKQALRNKPIASTRNKTKQSR